jgi:hypothetical protein
LGKEFQGQTRPSDGFTESTLEFYQKATAEFRENKFTHTQKYCFTRIVEEQDKRISPRISQE